MGWPPSCSSESLKVPMVKLRCLQCCDVFSWMSSLVLQTLLSLPSLLFTTKCDSYFIPSRKHQYRGHLSIHSCGSFLSSYNVLCSSSFEQDERSPSLGAYIPVWMTKNESTAGAPANSGGNGCFVGDNTGWCDAECEVREGIIRRWQWSHHLKGRRGPVMWRPQERVFQAKGAESSSLIWAEMRSF